MREQKMIFDLCSEPDRFVDRHLGPSEADVKSMLSTLGVEGIEALTDRVVPGVIRSSQPLQLEPPRTEHAILAEFRAMAAQNRVLRS